MRRAIARSGLLFTLLGLAGLACVSWLVQAIPAAFSACPKGPEAGHSPELKLGDFPVGIDRALLARPSRR